MWCLKNKTMNWMVTWSHDHHMIHHIRQRSLFDRFACMVNKIKCETYLPESQVVIWFITSSNIICDLINLRSDEWVMVLHSIWCYCHMCNHDIIYFVHILCSRAASKWLLLSGMRGRSNQSESNDSIDFIWILGHRMMILHMIPETTFAVSILSVTLMADKALQHVRWGESTTSELQIMTIWEFVAWDVQRQIQVSRASRWSCTAWPAHGHEWIRETIVWKRTCWLQTHFSNEYDKLNYAMNWANHSSENRIHFFPRPQHEITSIIVQIKMH